MFDIILASASAGRRELLNRIGLTPSQVVPTNIDESELPKELPKSLALRLADTKARAAAALFDEGIIIAADTVTCVGRRILPKAIDDKTVEFCLRYMSGRRHGVYTGLCVIMKKDREIINFASKVVSSSIKYKRLTNSEIACYVKTKEGIGKSGGTTIQGLSEIFIERMVGSHSNIIGLPLHELYLILNGFGLKLEDIVKEKF